jgi:hypothetical protein
MAETAEQMMLRMGFDAREVAIGLAKVTADNEGAAAKVLGIWKKEGSERSMMAEKEVTASEERILQIEVEEATRRNRARLLMRRRGLEQEAALQKEFAAIAGGSVPANMSPAAAAAGGAAAGGAAAAAGAGGFIAAAAAYAAIESVLQKVQKFSNVAEITGQSFEEIQKLDYAFKMTGIDVDKGNQNLERLNQLVGEAREGGDEAQKKFAKWGISIDGKNNADIFNEMADKIQSIKDPAERSALAFDLMGKSGRELIPLLERGSKAMAEMGNHAQILSESDKKNILTAKEGVEAIGNWFMVKLGEGIARVADTAKFIGAMSTGMSPNHAADVVNQMNAADEAAGKSVIDPTHAAAAATASAQKKAQEDFRKHEESVTELRRKGETTEQRMADDLARKAVLESQIFAFKTQGRDVSEMTAAVDKINLQIQQDGKDAAKEKAEAEKKATEEKQKQNKINDEATNLSRKINQNEHQMGQQEMVYPTIENLAGRNYTENLNKRYGKGGRFDLGRGDGYLGGAAREYELAGKQQQWDRTYGNNGDAENDRQRMIAARDKLIENGAASPEMQMEKMRENTDAMKDHLKNLVTGGAVIKTSIQDEAPTGGTP